MILEFLDLKKQDRIIQNKTMNWLKTLTTELDFENGKSFVKFVQHNLKLDYPYSVFILYNKELKKVLGIASVVPDDQDVGKEHNLDGIWIAGVNIRRDERDKGYGKILFENIDLYLSKLKLGSLRVNLFVNNTIALKMYENFGFRQIGLKVDRQNKENIVCTKYYN